MSINFKLYEAAKAADDAFTRELVRVYGARACDARYRFKHDDAAVIAAKDAKLKADAAWLGEMLRHRETV